MEDVPLEIPEDVLAEATEQCDGPECVSAPRNTPNKELERLTQQADKYHGSLPIARQGKIHGLGNETSNIPLIPRHIHLFDSTNSPTFILPPASPGVQVVLYQMGGGSNKATVGAGYNHTQNESVLINGETSLSFGGNNYSRTTITNVSNKLWILDESGPHEDRYLVNQGTGTDTIASSSYANLKNVYVTMDTAQLTTAIRCIAQVKVSSNWGQIRVTYGSDEVESSQFTNTSYEYISLTLSITAYTSIQGGNVAWEGKSQTGAETVSLYKPCTLMVLGF